MTAPRFRIYYQEKDPHNSDQGAPVKEQARGVMCIIQEDHDLGWAAQSDADYYVCRAGVWFGVDIFGLFDFLMDSGLVVFGRMVDRGEYSQVMSEALEDQDLAKKTGYLPRRYKERKG